MDTACISRPIGRLGVNSFRFVEIKQKYIFCMKPGQALTLVSCCWRCLMTRLSVTRVWMLAPVPCLTCLPVNIMTFDKVSLFNVSFSSAALCLSSLEPQISRIKIRPASLPVSGRLIRFLSFSCRLTDEEVEVIEAEEEDGDDIVETVDEVDDLCRSMGEGFSFRPPFPSPFPAPFSWCKLSCWPN